MTYRIDYFRSDVLKSSEPWSGSLDECIRIAEDELVRYGFEIYRIVNRTGETVASGPRGFVALDPASELSHRT